MIHGCSVLEDFVLLVGYLEPWINDSISLKSWDEYIEDPEEHEAGRGNSFHCVFFEGYEEVW